MDPFDDYRPDPPTGLGYSDFRAARARHFARVAVEAEIARLERVLALPSAATDVGASAGDRERPHGGRPDGGGR